MDKGSIILLLVILSCSGPLTDPQPAVKDSHVISAPVQSFHAEDSVSGFEEYATFFIVVADTGKDYTVLQGRMMELNSNLKLEVDSMGRYYNSAKDLIALPDSSDDELYAGDYFPRRFPSEHLSIEYLDFYKKEAGDKTMAIVTGIFDNEISADKALAEQRKFMNSTFKIKANIYTGCMH